MDFLTYGLAQTLTYWELTGVDGYNQPQFAAPVSRTCRWEERTTRIQNTEGQEVLARARIFLAEDMKLGDYIALGVVAGADPRVIPQARAVIEFRKTPSLDGASFERKSYI
jgi:hypothetical protein